MKTQILLPILFFVSLGFGQNSLDLANLYYRTSPLNSVKDSAHAYTLNTFAADFKLPLVINDENVALIGLDYQKNAVQNSLQSRDNIDFTSASLQIGLEHKWNKRSKMLFMSITRLNSDFKSIGFNHFQQGGLVLGTTAHSSHFDWKYGAYYNGEFFGPMFVPLFGFNWKMNDQWRLKVIVPLNFDLSYQPTANFITGLRFDGVNASFRTNQNPLQKDAYIDKADNNLWAFSELEIGKNCWFHIKAGYSILRKYRIYEKSDELNWKLGPVNFGDERPAVATTFDNGFSFEARFIYRLQLKDQ